MLKKLLFTLLAASTLQAGAKGTMHVDLSEGSAVITPEQVTVGDSDPVSTAMYSNFLITTSGETTNGLIITGGTETAPVDIILENVNINRGNVNNGDYTLSCPIYIEKGYVHLLIAGESTLKAGVDNPGICVPDGAVLTISNAYETGGILHATGGSDVGGGGGGAGIGGTVNGTCGTLILNSGTIYARGWKGGAGFGSGWQWEPTATKSGGTFIQNGGEAHFSGSSAGYNSYLRGSCFEGIGSVDNATKVELNGGTFYSTIRTSANVTVKGETASAHTFNGMTPGASYTLYGQFGTPETTVTADQYGNFIYWLAGEQAISDLIGDRCTVKVATEPGGNGTITGAGFYTSGETVEFRYTAPVVSVYDFDSWDNGATDNPTSVTITGDMSIVANVSPKVWKMWRVGPIIGSETECHVWEFDSSEFTGDVLDLPETFDIDGKTFTTTALGDPSTYMFNILTTIPVATLTLPSSLKSIVPSAFSRIKDLKTVVVNAATPPALMGNSEEFYSTPTACTLKVPSGTSEAYSTAPGWKDFASIEELPKTVVTLDITEHSASITSEGYTIGDTFEAFTGRYVITTSAPTANTLTIAGGTEDTPLRITFDNVEIDNSACTEAAPAGGAVIVNSGYVDLTLSGESTLRGGKKMAGLNIPYGATVAIDGGGVLRSYGGSTTAGGYGSAGIGAFAGGTCGKLIVNGGTVYGQGALGGAGFGSGAGYGYIGSKPGGVLVMNGGEATFEGSYSGTDTWSVTQGVGSTNGDTSVEINGGTLNTSFHSTTKITYHGESLTRQQLRGLTPETTYVLYDMLGMPEYKETSTVNRDIVFISYWLTPGQTLQDLLGDRVLVQAETQYDSDNGIVYGGGIYEKGTEVEFRYERPTNDPSFVRDFDHWSNGSTDMPLRLTVEEDMTLTAYLTARVEYMWHTSPIDETDYECYVSQFRGQEFKEAVLEVPATFEIDGETHVTTAFGHPESGQIQFELGYWIEELILPETINKVGANALNIHPMFGMPHEEGQHTITCHASTPPAIVGGDTFFLSSPEKYTLKVPKGTAEAHKAAPGWKDFYTIQEQVTTGLDAVIIQTTGVPVYYDLRGVRMGGDVSTLAPGIYIERRGTTVTKVLISR